MKHSKKQHKSKSLRRYKRRRNDGGFFDSVVNIFKDEFPEQNKKIKEAQKKIDDCKNAEKKLKSEIENITNLTNKYTKDKENLNNEIKNKTNNINSMNARIKKIQDVDLPNLDKKYNEDLPNLDKKYNEDLKNLGETYEKNKKNLGETYEKNKKNLGETYENNKKNLGGKLKELSEILIPQLETRIKTINEIDLPNLDKTYDQNKSNSENSDSRKNIEKEVKLCKDDGPTYINLNY